MLHRNFPKNRTFRVIILLDECIIKPIYLYDIISNNCCLLKRQKNVSTSWRNPRNKLCEKLWKSYHGIHWRHSIVTDKEFSFFVIFFLKTRRDTFVKYYDNNFSPSIFIIYPRENYRQGAGKSIILMRCLRDQTKVKDLRVCNLWYCLLTIFLLSFRIQRELNLSINDVDTSY